MFERLVAVGYQVMTCSHAEAILAMDFPDSIAELEEVLSSFRIPVAEIIASGGGEAKGTQRLRRSLAEHGWNKHKFEIKKIVDGVERESISHEIDHVKTIERGDQRHTLALEIEWNNKDPFFDRDLENFKRLHAEGAISVGILVTRGSSLQDGLRSIVMEFIVREGVEDFVGLETLGIEPTRRQRDAVLQSVSRGKSFKAAWTEHFVADKFGAATTHWRKLMDRVGRGVGNPCPLLLIGLPAGILVP